MIISEFFNSYVRREFKIRNKQDPSQYADFKEDFRATVDYKDLMKILKSTYKKLEKICKKLDDDFKKIDMDKVLKDMEKFDFNDKYCICLAEMKKLKIVTHDKDFMISQVPIITANRSLLRKK